MEIEASEITNAVTRDRLLGGRVILCQPREGYRVAIDPVLLAAAIPAQAGDRVLDVGAGAGALAMCLAQRVPGVSVDGIEVLSKLTDLARRNAVLNGLRDSTDFHVGDISMPGRDIANRSYDHVMANPPYLERGRAVPSIHYEKALATVESDPGLGEWVKFCVGRAATGGSVTFIHRADRLADLLAALKAEAGGIIIYPLWPKTGSPAKRIIVQARKGVDKPAQLKAGLVLHQPDGDYTEEAQAVLRDGQALEI